MGWLKRKKKEHLKNFLRQQNYCCNIFWPYIHAEIIRLSRKMRWILNIIQIYLEQWTTPFLPIDQLIRKWRVFNKRAESYAAKKLFWSSPEKKQTLPKGIFTMKFEYCLMFTYIINVNKTAYYFSCIVMDYGVYMAWTDVPGKKFQFIMLYLGEIRVNYYPKPIRK